MIKSISIYSIAVAAFLTFALFTSYKSGDNPNTSSQTLSSKDSLDGKLPQIITGIDLNKQYSFAGENVPLNNFDVVERLDRELLVNSYWHSSTVQNIKLANRYLPTIANILNRNGVPEDFKYLAIAESGLRNVVSPAGAKGLWQFMKGTGQEYGLEVATEVDERYHLEKSTEAACKYLKKLKDRFGSWTLAAAAYNMGGSRLRKEMDAQKEDNYYDLNLNQETSRYIFRILAYKEIINNPARFGFQIDAKHLYKPLNDYVNIVVNTSISSWGDWAEQNGVTYRMLKVYNPWLISSKLTNNRGKEYLIKIPKK